MKLRSLFLCFLCLFATRADATMPTDERNALIALYNSTNGPGWLGTFLWLDDPGTECLWYGVTCDANEHVEELDLSNNNMVGSIPPEIGNLWALERLLLEGNHLNGSIPPEIGNLTFLNYLWLSDNELTGSIPTTLFEKLDLLETLWLYSNDLTGTIPPGIGNCTDLVVLYLHENRLSGAIPPEIGDLISLTNLALSSNLLSGEIPTELMSLTGLNYLMLCDNYLYTDDPALRSFLDSHSPGWEECQDHPIFTDDFESGNTTAWTASLP